MKKTCLAAALLAFAAFVASGQSAVAGSAASDPAGAPKLRLPAAARPIRYDAQLTIVPEKPTFSGHVEIEIDLSAPTRLLWLNATELTVSDARIAVGSRKIAARVIPGGDDFLGLAFDKPVGPGKARLSLSYSGKVSDTNTTGIFRQKVGEDWYAFTQFEAIDARRAFPCFDEPSYKVPWRLTLRVPATATAVSNTSIESEDPAADGQKTIHFRETRPLPSYLVAFGVGPFDYVDAGRAGRNHTPLRMVVPRGRSGEARYAAETMGQILETLEDYFGTPYPYPKLDNLVIPQTVRFGAMENAGLVTYNESILLALPDRETPSFKRRWASISAHETAHQWFGDWVTLAWWNDTWLNESFATWMSSKVLEKWKPDWNAPVARVIERAETMDGDTLVSARKIHQPIEAKGDIDNAFDNISYGKGAAVLSMFESWTGPDKFQKGVRRYLAAHAYGNATSEDFLASLEAEGGSGLAKAFSTFLDQAGVPLVKVVLSCSAGQPPAVDVSQNRLLPKGSPASAPQVWSIPVCLRFGGDGWSDRSCELVAGQTQRLVLKSAKACPSWVLGNEGEIGYYAVVYEPGALEKLLREGGASLTLSERVGVLEDVAQLARTGEVPWARALALVPEFASDPNPRIASTDVALADGVEDHLVDASRRENYERFARKLFATRAHALGWNPKPGEDDETQLLRPRLVGFAARIGKDPELRQEARALAVAWLDDPKAVGTDTVGSVLAIAAEDGDRALFDRFRARARTVKERRDRVRLLAALVRFPDPALQKEALAIVLSGDFDIRESTNILFTALGHPDTREMAWQFFKTNFDALVAKLPQEMDGVLPRAGSVWCDAAHRADVEAFFKPRIDKLTGGARTLAETLETVDQCEALKAGQSAAVGEFLAKY